MNKSLLVRFKRTNYHQCKGAIVVKNLPNISYAIHPEKVFKDVHHYKNVTSSILGALHVSKAKKSKGKAKNPSYLISRLVVNFSSAFKEEQITIDHLNGTVILEAPKSKRESKKNLDQRRISYLTELLKSIEAMKTIGITHIYLVLSEEGRELLNKTTNKASK